MGRKYKNKNITKNSIELQKILPGRLIPVKQTINKLDEPPGYKVYLIPDGYQPYLLPSGTLSNDDINISDINNYTNTQVEKDNEITRGLMNKEKIPRPLNSFLIYRKHKSIEVKKENPELNNQMISKIVGKLWNNELDSVKKHYHSLANDLKKKHSLMFPNYKFCPKRNIPRFKQGNNVMDNTGGPYTADHSNNTNNSDASISASFFNNNNIQFNNENTNMSSLNDANTSLNDKNTNINSFNTTNIPLNNRSVLIDKNLNTFPELSDSLSNILSESINKSSYPSNFESYAIPPTIALNNLISASANHSISLNNSLIPVPANPGISLNNDLYNMNWGYNIEKPVSIVYNYPQYLQNLQYDKDNRHIQHFSYF